MILIIYGYMDIFLYRFIIFNISRNQMMGFRILINPCYDFPIFYRFYPWNEIFYVMIFIHFCFSETFRNNYYIALYINNQTFNPSIQLYLENKLLDLSIQKLIIIKICEPDITCKNLFD